MSNASAAAAADPDEAAQRDLSDIARLGYIYGFPAFEVARLRWRALSRPRHPMRVNVLRHKRPLSGPDNSDVTAVNSDTLLSRAWLDLSQGPLLIHLPDAGDRYYSLALMDCFSNNFAVLGRRRPGRLPADVLLVGPRWQGGAPGGAAGGATVVRAPTDAVWALARILVRGPQDLAAVHALQDRLAIAPHGTAAGRYPPPLRVAPLDAQKPLVFFDVLNAVLRDNPPPEADRPVIDRLRPIGVGPGERFRRSEFAPPQLAALRRGIAEAQRLLYAQVGFRTGAAPPAGHWPSDELLARLAPRSQTPARRREGWSGPVGAVGDFGTDYLLRAQCALAGLGLLPREEAMYFTTATDAGGAPLDGRSRYVLRFRPDGLPPVDAFWSLTVYRTDESNRRWLVPNAIGRYSIGSHTPALRRRADGGLEIAIQEEAPDAGTENWLPAPRGPFMLTLRAYQPHAALLDGDYAIPEVERAP
ncbi:MAG TPA: DUF1254 domain-containing protein [Stellaceae bacterium]|nr:DUF1254 domain-containing protein [Stellaceae bacterium]